MLTQETIRQGNFIRKDIMRNTWLYCSNPVCQCIDQVASCSSVIMKGLMHLLLETKSCPQLLQLLKILSEQKTSILAFKVYQIFLKWAKFGIWKMLVEGRNWQRSYLVLPTAEDKWGFIDDHNEGIQVEYSFSIRGVR